ncbi:MAG: hypothetical protein MUD14_27140 [Hydrococcus sp. Prado102]|jgi:hypothetical protein|nr:hypothetical protein [Hydrococcus sp. Prado102]
MTSQPTNTNTESDVSERVSSISSTEEELASTEQATTTETHEVRIELPQPDAENITVLTDKLPNKPILPWNRYDSPWEESESEPEATEESKEEDLADDEIESDEVK